MPVQANITDSTNKWHARVTKRGELVVAPNNFSEAYFNDMSTDDTAYNFVGPKAGEQFVITAVIADADRNVGANGASVVLYEATSPSTTTTSKTLLQFDMVKQTSKVLTGLNIGVGSGVWVNGKTDDNGVLMTVTGYYVNI